MPLHRTEDIGERAYSIVQHEADRGLVSPDGNWARNFRKALEDTSRMLAGQTYFDEEGEEGEVCR